MAYFSSVRVLRETSPRGVWLIGHRGAKGYAPENTLVSFDLAWRMGADAVECDVHLSRDGRCVVFHDRDLSRTSDGTGLVRERSVRELRKLDAGSWFSGAYRGQKIPLLEELLGWARGRKTPLGLPLAVIVEVKAEGADHAAISRRAVRTILKERMARRTILISMERRVLAEAGKAAPALLTGWVQESPAPDPVGIARQAKAGILLPRAALVRGPYVRRAHEKGIAVAPWTVDDRNEAVRLIRLGVDAISTNFPEMVNQVLAK